MKYGRCDSELLKTLVKNPSDVLAATPDRNQVSLLEGFGPGLLAKDKKNHAHTCIDMYTLLAEGKIPQQGLEHFNYIRFGKLSNAEHCKEQ